MAKIPETHLKKVCKMGQEGCCRYIMLGAGGFECAKHGMLRVTIDQRVKEGTIGAVGDNCDGR
jgi:hypothetical protein